MDKSLDVMYDADEFWNTIEGDPSLHGYSAVHLHKTDDSSYLNDFSFACPTELEYWDGYFC